MAQLKARGVKKTYLGLALGAVAATTGRIEAPIGRDPNIEPEWPSCRTAVNL